jgi:signal transduction histidine kinase
VSTKLQIPPKVGGGESAGTAAASAAQGKNGGLGGLTASVGRIQGRWTYAPIVLVAVLGLLVTWLVAARVTELEQQRRLSAFSEAARDRLLVVQRELAYAMGVVQDIASFFDASRHVSRRQFREFVGPAIKRNPGVSALGWVPRVPAEGLVDFLSAARRGFAPFRLVERIDSGEVVEVDESRPVHYPVLYVQPYPENKELLGRDLAAVPGVLAILEEAEVSRSMRVSVPQRPAGSGGRALTFGVYLPVYERAEEGSGGRSPEGDPDEAVETPGGPRGFAVGVFRVGDLIEHALQNLSPAGVDMRFYAGESGPEAVPFHVHASRTRGERRVSAMGGAEIDKRPRFTGEIPVEDRAWVVVCNPVPGYFEPNHWSSRFILGGGAAFTVLACVYLFALIGRAQQVRRLVAQRTLELERANAALNIEVAERRRAEQALQILNITLEHRIARRAAEAERRARDLEQFAYVASHDLKAPLRGIANLAGWLKEDLQDKLMPETAEQLNLLLDRVARMNALVEGLLAYSRIGRTEGTATEVDTAELVADTVDSLAPPPGFRVEVAPGMPRLTTDPLHLGQVFANLIGNAISHHDRDSGVVRVAGRELDGHCEFQVTDDGPGIPPEYREKVFMMFQTLTVKDFGGNTGIGLALVKKLVEEHGGAIRLRSGPSRGACFEFTWVKEDGEQSAGKDEEGRS